MDIDALVAMAAGLEPEEFRRVVRRRLWKLPAMGPGPRDVRRGDRWLPWHGRDDRGDTRKRKGGS